MLSSFGKSMLRQIALPAWKSFQFFSVEHVLCVQELLIEDPKLFFFFVHLEGIIALANLLQGCVEVILQSGVYLTFGNTILERLESRLNVPVLMMNDFQLNLCHRRADSGTQYP